MNWKWILFTYVVTFCTTLFVVLPFRLKFWSGLLANILLALAITAGIGWLIHSGLVPLNNIR